MAHLLKNKKINKSAGGVFKYIKSLGLGLTLTLTYETNIFTTQQPHLHLLTYNKLQ